MDVIVFDTTLGLAADMLNNRIAETLYYIFSGGTREKVSAI
jgi:hypothetical protein